MDDKVTTWRPSTCDCVVSYSWDRSVPQGQRVLTAFCLGEKEVADLDALTGAQAYLCGAHRVLDTTVPWVGNASALIRLDWHIKRAAPVYAAVLRENIAVTQMATAYARLIPRLRAEGSVDELAPGLLDFSFTGTGADRQVSVGIIGVSLAGQEKQLVRAEAAKQPIPVTVR